MSRETEGLASLVTAIDDVVEGAAAARSLPDVDVRRLLRFISQVIQVVEQAFQDVLGVLTDVSYLEPSDLRDHRRMTEFGKNGKTWPSSLREAIIATQRRSVAA